MINKKQEKRGILFITDAIIASTLLVMILFISSNLYQSETPTITIEYMSQDLINALSEMKVGEIDSDYARTLIANGNITYLNNSILEQIGEFWSEGNEALAYEFAKNITENLIPKNLGYSILINKENIYVREKLQNQTIVSARKIVSGLAKSVPLRGISTQVYLKSIDYKDTSAVLFFGGFVGQGNISKTLKILPADADIKSMFFELDSSSNFKLKINGNTCERTPGNAVFNINTEELTATRFNITQCKGFINKGSDNEFHVNFLGPLNNSYIGGGLIKINYKTETLNYNETKNITRYEFPFISGLINLYSSFYVPGSIDEMNLHLHYYSNLSAYLKFGGFELFTWNANDTIEIKNISNIEILNRLNELNITYDEFSSKVVPLRFGLRNISFEISKRQGTGNAVLITDTSGSMNVCDMDNSDGNVPNCQASPPLANRIDVAKHIDKTFVKSMLENSTGNLLGLVEYATSIKSYYNLSEDQVALEAEIDSYTDDGWTCISCGVKRATELLVNFTDTLIDEKSVWKYNNEILLDSPPENWTKLDFDDSAWNNGKAPLGFGSGQTQTDIGDSKSANLWSIANDQPAPVSFRSGLNSTKNTFGFLPINTNLIMFSEGFESGSFNTNSWSSSGDVSILSGASAHSGSYYARFRYAWWHASPYIIKTLDATGYENVRITYYGRLYSCEDDELLRLLVRKGTGGSWTIVNTFNWMDSSWTFADIDISEYADDSVFQIAFQFTGGDNSNEGALLDDINITGMITDIDDGWDWATHALTPDLYCESTRNMRSYGDPSSLSGSTENNRLKVEIGGGSCGAGCGYCDSGAFGILTHIGQDMINLIEDHQRPAVVSFYYEAKDREPGTAETEESSWIKARFGNESEMHYLGYHLDTGLGNDEHVEDDTKEILWDWIEHGSPVQWHEDNLRGDFDMDEDSVRNSGYFIQNITKYIESEDYYYLELGAKFDATGPDAYQGNNEGIIAYFDDVIINVANKSGHFYFRKKFNITSKSTLINPELFLMSDDRAEVYINSKLYINETSSHRGFYWNRNITVNASDLNAGENIIAVKIYNDDYISSLFDLKLTANRNKQKAMLIMSDGQANRCHSPGWSSWNCNNAQAGQETIDFACEAHEKYNISIYTVAFGADADIDILNQTACCDNCSNFYFGNNVAELENIYKEIAEKMIEATRDSQSLMIERDFTHTTLYNDSFIEFIYDSDIEPLQPGEITITLESEKFSDCAPKVLLPPNVRIIDAKITSYSSKYWTSKVTLNNQTVYDLSEWGTEYSEMGDPFIINIPPDKLVTGAVNNFTINLSETNSSYSSCSKNNSLIYTIAFSSNIPYGSVKSGAAGCKWTIEYEDLSTQTINIPDSYSGPKECFFTGANVEFDEDDSIDIAVFELLNQLDFNNNNRSDINFNQADLMIQSISVVDIPTMWGPAITELRIW